ncbi:hypothetical protein [Pseudopedobacter beijingensis]|uniref:DUF4168 domain-containing protein n=1 Tax=Pseudopedobacter beijingensis TaxID=1207056 RepID=A0ABW4I6E3_9SPHI
MKKLSLLTLLVGLFFFANAQNKPSFSYYSLETLEAIGTSKEQQTQIFEIRKNSEERVRAVKKDASLNEEEKKAKYKEIYGEGGALYKKVLTSEQNEKLKILFKEFQENNK